MPVYMHIFNLIINKKAILEKYSGGMETFKKNFQCAESEFFQEDNHLISLGRMDTEPFEIEKLVKNGLFYNKFAHDLNDLVILYRYDNDSLKVGWLKHNKVFAWHIDSSNMELIKVNEISKMSMDEIGKLFDEGQNPFKTI